MLVYKICRIIYHSKTLSSRRVLPQAFGSKERAKAFAAFLNREETADDVSYDVVEVKD